MKVGEIKGPLESRDEKGRTFYKLLYLNSQTAPHRANLQQDYSDIKEMALNNKRHKILEEWITDRKERTYIKIDEAYKNCNLSPRGLGQR